MAPTREDLKTSGSQSLLSFDVAMKLRVLSFRDDSHPPAGYLF
jgi:hypothetical protein